MLVSETLHGFLDAFSNLQLNDMMKYFDNEATAFFPIKYEHQKLVGKQDIREAFSKVIKNVKKAGLTKISLDAEDIEITCFADIALVTFYIRDNELNRRTLVLKQCKERWFIIHLHASNAPLLTPMGGGT